MNAGRNAAINISRASVMGLLSQDAPGDKPRALRLGFMTPFVLNREKTEMKGEKGEKHATECRKVEHVLASSL